MPYTDETVYYRDIVNSLKQALVVVDAGLVVRFANLGFYEMFASGEKETLHRKLSDHMPELASDAKLAALLSVVPDHDVTVERYLLPQEFPIIGRRMLEISARRIRRNGIAIDRAIVRIEDVTEDTLTFERKAQEVEQSRAQITEINHRVKNNLASILSMLRLERRAVDTPETNDTLVRVSARIEQIANLYELLALNWSGGRVKVRDYLTAICQSVEAVTGANGQSWLVTVSGDNAPISIDEALALGAVVNELVVNAGKYAFADDVTNGRIEVVCTFLGDALQVVVRDNGSGFHAVDRAPKSTGLGMKLVEVYLANLGGKREQRSTPGEGTQHTILIPHGGHGETEAIGAAKVDAGANV